MLPAMLKGLVLLEIIGPSYRSTLSKILRSSRVEHARLPPTASAPQKAVIPDLRKMGNIQRWT